MPALLTWAIPLHAQASLRLGGIRARYADSLSVTAAQIGARFDWIRNQDRAALEASYAALSHGGWAAQFSGETGTSRSLGKRALGWGLAAGGNVLQGGTWSGQLLALGGVSERFGLVAVTAGFSLGALRSVGDTVGFLKSVRMSAGSHLGPLDATLRLRHVRVSRFIYSEAELGVAQRVGAVSIDAGGGYRESTSGAHWPWHLQGTLQLARALALEAGGGAAAPSPEGFSEGLYATAGLRFTAAGRAPRRPVVERTAAGVRVHFAVANASEVSIAGDWNQWTPVPMTRDADGRWSGELPLGAGAHRFVLTADGKTLVPPGVPKLPDGFGGEVGLLVL